MYSHGTIEGLYVQSIQMNLNFNYILFRLIDELDTEYEKRQQSSEFYYDYPVNAFKAINRIAADWQEVFKLTRQIENLTSK